MAFLGSAPHASGDRLGALPFLQLLADETRLEIIGALARSDLRAGELGARAGAASNALAYHLKRLRALGVVRSRQSNADARDVYYQLDAGRLRALYVATGDALYPGLLLYHAAASGEPTDHQAAPSPTATTAITLSRPLRVLFLCTQNSARSQLAEALLRHMGGDQVEVLSAGSQPTVIHPETIATLRELGIDTQGLYAKSLDQFTDQRFDYVITVCDRVREVCPTFVGDPAQAHWSIPDPTLIEEPERRARAFRDVASELQTRIRYLLLLPHPATGERFRTPSL
jgi:protein-tyrosine-phosphatase/DNA-binding transcriptional ArsR family regulator